MDEALSESSSVPRLRHALVRVGEPVLQRYVGEPVVNFAQLLGQTVSAMHLADVLIERYGPQGLIESQTDLLGDIFQALSREEATDLEKKCTGSSSSTPWDTLRKIPLPLQLTGIQKVCEFFGVSWASPPPEDPADPSVEEVCGAYPLYEYQTRTIERALHALNHQDRRALIHMPTGSGKTRLAMALIARMLSQSKDASVVIWLAHSEELCDQAADEFKKCWSAVGNRTLSIGRFYRSHEIDLGSFHDGLLVAGLSKLFSRSAKSQTALFHLKSRTAMVVMDEAHQAIAPTYRHLLESLAPLGGGVALLGLSATPGRSWLDIDQDQELADFFSRKKIVLESPPGLNPIAFLQRDGYLAVPEYCFIPYRPTLTLSDADNRALAAGLDMTEETLRKLGDDMTRNLLILREVANRASSGRKIIIFACSVGHAESLADSLTMLGVRAAVLSASTPGNRRRALLNDFKSTATHSLQILVNFAILTTGFDAPKTSVVVVARPTQSIVLYSQMIGRAMRGPKANGNASCIVVTVQDELPGFRSIYEGFSHWEDVW
jgi:DNA repair protein RadD